MKDFINGIIKADIEQWMGFLFISFIASMLVIFVTSVASDHVVDCYYMKTVTTKVGPAYSIYGSVNWAEDFTAFVSTDHNEMLTVLNEFKKCGDK